MPKDRAHDSRRQAEYEKLVGKIAYDLVYPKDQGEPDRNKEKEWDLTMKDENLVHQSKVKGSGPTDDGAPEGWHRTTPETMGEMSNYYSKGAK